MRMFTSLFLRCRISNGWRSFATRTDLVLPWLMLSSPTDPETRYFFDVVGGETLELNREIHLPQISSSVCIGSSEGFLFTVATHRSPKEIHAVNPLNPREDRLLLPALCDRYEDTEDYAPYIGKIVLSPSRDVAVLLHNGNGMVEYARLSPLASSSWTPLQTHRDPSTPCDSEMLSDCIFHKGRLHVSNEAGTVAIIDMDDPSIPPLFYSDAPQTVNQDNSEFYWDCFRRSLVESPDGKDLFLLTRFSHGAEETFHFEVFKLGDNNSWNQVGSIGELAFFVGSNTSVAMSAVDFPKLLEPNSIYFTDDDMEEFGDTGVFSLDDGSVRFFNLTRRHRQLNWSEPQWFMPKCS